MDCVLAPYMYVYSWTTVSVPALPCFQFPYPHQIITKEPYLTSLEVFPEEKAFFRLEDADPVAWAVTDTGVESSQEPGLPACTQIWAVLDASG